MPIIELDGLRKTYRRLRGGATTALDGLDLEIERGGVFGLLGPNGSGKTTTIRCLLGLARADSGTCRILGRDPATELHEVIRRIGSIVESPALFPNFSGRRNLELLAAMYSIGRPRVDAVLEQVDLRERQKDLVRTYSLGMRQRLAIAAALLKDPEVLILDEPANGLDPAGIKDVRELLRRLGDDGCSVVVSSHILAEVQQLCDRLAILSHGRRVVQGDVDEVLMRGRSSGVWIKIDDVPSALRALGRAKIASSATDGMIRADVAPEAGAHVAKTLAEAGLYPSEIRPDEVDLETVFLELTQARVEVAA